jgi:hypothetical protein
MIIKLGTLLCLLATACTLSAQDNFFQNWETRTARTQSRQPVWIPPVASTFVGLIQCARADFTRQLSPTNGTTWNYGTSKGANLIPFANTEIDINLPPYFQRSTSSLEDGAGDMSFLAKYRLLTGNEEHGNYAVSAFALSTIPTGSHKNGSTNGSIAPTLGMGKGFGRFNMQSTLGVTLPTGNTAKLGRPVVWNITGQYHIGRYLWPELEFNSTYFHGGPNDNKTQTFATPGFTLGRIKFRPSDEKSRLGIGLGGGMQMALSKFHTYNHGLIFTSRFLF